MKVLVEDHNPGWKFEFSRARNELQVILKNIPILSIEHVGSTSIPGLPAKPVLDIDIVVTVDALEATRSAMKSGGYLDMGEMGVPGRVAFRQPGYQISEFANGTKLEGREMRRNTYVVLDGCLSLRNHLDLKRVLLEDTGLRDEYGTVKRKLASKELEDVDEYCCGKNEVMLKILRKAGWSEEDLEEVRKANE